MNGQVNLQYDFQKCLNESHRVSDLPFWYDLYEKFFQNMVSSSLTTNMATGSNKALIEVLF